MPITFIVNKEQELLETKAFGKLTGEELFQFQQDAVNDPNWQPHFNHLMDLREADLSFLTNEMLDIAAKKQPSSPTAKRELIVANASSYKTTYIYELLTNNDSNQISSFMDIETAKAWLDESLEPSNYQ